MIGIDEVGRGAWAGPLLVVAVRKKHGRRFPGGLTDSKQLTKKRREALFGKLMAVCDVGEGWVSASVIDEIGLSAALKSASMLAAAKIEVDKDELVLIDGTVNFLHGTRFTHVTCRAKADLTDPSVSAASIVAKVLRDQYMQYISEDYPNYGFEAHVGYGTKRHIEALERYGATRVHRKSFAPVAALL